MYPEIKDHPAAQYWNARLNFKPEVNSFGTGKELAVVLVISLFAGLIAQIPWFAGIEQDAFYQRNIGFVVFPALTFYFAWKRKAQTMKTLAITTVMLLAAWYMHLLSDNSNGDTYILACIHLPLFLWALTGLVFTGFNLRDFALRLDYLRFNGDLFVMTAVLLIAGGLMTGITMGLFELIGINIEAIFTQYILIFGLAAVPVIATYLVQVNPQMVSKVSPVIARVFTPLVLVMLVVYLIAVIYTGRDPFNDREFPLIFNLLLIGVMAIIFFAIAGIPNNTHHTTTIVLLFCLAVLTIVVNGIALSAILFRIGEWGMTPNRLAVAGTNILFLLNLLIVAYMLFMVVRSKKEIENVGNSIASFLPIYTLWIMLVVFVFPLLFNYN